MVKYNPRTWFSLIFHSYSRQVLAKLLPAILSMGAFTTAFCFFVLHYLKLRQDHFQGTTVVHSLLGIVLGLFLVFRTNSAYDRWWEGRRLWGGLVNSTRNFAIKLNAYLPPEEREQREWFGRMIPNFVYAMKEHLRKGVKFEELEPVDSTFTEELMKVNHRPNRLSAQMYERLNSLYVNKRFSESQLLNLDKEMKDFIDILGACERIKNTPIPYSYTMYIKKFIFLYIVTLPFGFIATFGYFTIATVILVSYVLLSVELIAEEIEDPFGRDINDLPTDELASKIRGNVKEILNVQEKTAV